MATSDRRTTFVFLLGTGRCGSSLLHEVIARHPEVGFVSNLDDRLRGRWNPAWNGPVYRRTPVARTRKGRLRFAPSEGYRVLDRQVSRAVSVPVRDLVAADATPWLAERFRGFFERQARRQGAPVFVHKFTGWPRAGFVQEVFPDARFIHVIRDGRAVASSLLQMPWWRGYEGTEAWGWGPLPGAYQQEWEASGRSFPVLAALEWKLLMDTFEQARSRVAPERWVDVRYEDLVQDPRGVTEGLLEQIGLNWTPGFERTFQRFSFAGGRVDAFRQDLLPGDVVAIERVLADRLEELGYVQPDAGSRSA